MFSALFNRAQATVDNAISQALNRAILAVPFVLATAFALAALTSYLRRELGEDAGLLAMAGVLGVIGLLMTLVVATSRAVAGPVPMAEIEEAPVEGSKEREATLGAEVDKEMLTAALASMAPMALPTILRVLFRNLPLLIVIAVFLFSITREGSSDPATAAPPTGAA